MRTTEDERLLESLKQLLMKLDVCIDEAKGMSKGQIWKLKCYKDAKRCLEEIYKDWKDVNHPAVPYIQKADAAMSDEDGPWLALDQIKEAIRYLESKRETEPEN